MSDTYTAVDLSKLPAPSVVETLDYETILADMITLARSVMDDFTTLDSDPVMKLLQVFAYREITLRQRVNDAGKAVMLAYAGGTDLDNLGALFDVTRLMLNPGDTDKGIDPTYESDEDFRRRITLAPESYSVAGPEGAYVYHAISASPDILDAAATSPSPGDVVVYILTRSGMTASEDLCMTVKDYLSADTRRPLTDHVTVESAEIVPYAVTATIATFAGPDSAVVMATAQSNIEAYAADSMRLGRDITLSGIYAALHVAGVQNVALTSPTADIVCERHQAPVCPVNAIALTYGGIGE